MPLAQHPSHILRAKTGPDDPELLETLKDALGQVKPAHWIAIADELAARSEQFAARLAQSDFPWIARAVTHARRRAETLTEFLTQHNVSLCTTNLLYGKGMAGERLSAFTTCLNGLDERLKLELATGLLHSTVPNDYWLWTRWLWDATTQTGILPLLSGSVHNLRSNGVAESYARVGAATAMSLRFAENTGLLTPEILHSSRCRPFAADVFLAAAYSIYAYGITGWRLSREFNRLLPTLPNLMRQLLGLPKQR